MFGVLLKKQFNEKLSYFKRDKRNIDYVGMILTAALIAVMLYVLVEVFSIFVEKYTAVRINGVLDVRSRERELLSIIYEVVIVICTLSAIPSINYSIFDNDDKVVMATLPIKTPVIFGSKLLYVYFEQALFSICVTAPLVAIFTSVTNKDAVFVIVSIIIGLVLPLYSIGLASIICLPYYYIKKFFQSKFILMLLVMTTVIGVCCYFYSSILNIIENLMATGEIKFFFNGETMQKIMTVANALAPACFIAEALMGIDIAKNIFISLAILVGIDLVGLFIVYMLYSRIVKASMGNAGHILLAPRKIHSNVSPNLSLLIKEIEMVIFTPDYSIQYFSVALIMPLMVYFCIGLGSNMIASLVLVERDFELGLILVLIFGALTNTFSATNISRDGKAFYLQKTMPLRGSQIIGAKVALNLIVNLISIGISATILTACKYVTAGQGAFIFLVGAIMGLSQIFVATRKDLNHPHFPQDDDNIVKESNNNVSIVITMGLISSLVVGIVPLALSIIKWLNGIDYTWFTYTYAILVSVLILTLSTVYMFVGLKKRFNSLSEGN